MAKFEKERNELKATLDRQIAKDNINYEEMTTKRIQESLAEAKQASDKELDQMNGFLQQKIEKNLNLEMQLDDLKDAYVTLEQNLSGEDKSYRQKLEVLESSNREISNMY